MRAFHYATALHSLLALHPEKEDELITQFMSTVRANGHEHLLIKIVRSFEKIEKKILTASTIEVTSVVKMSTEEVTKLLRTEPFSKLLSTKHKHVIRKEDDTLVGGVVVKAGSLSVDQSYKRALLDLYQNITK